MAKTATQQSDRQVAFSFVALIALLALVGATLWGIWKALNDTSPTVAAAIIAVSVTALVSIASLIYTKRWERQSVIQQEHRERKTPTYTTFIAFLFKSFRSTPANRMTPEELNTYLDKFTQELIIWGSGEVLRKYRNFRRESVKLGLLDQSPTESGEQRPEVTEQVKASMLAFETVLYAIRSDLGHDTKGMKPGELLDLFITDADSFFDLNPAS